MDGLRTVAVLGVLLAHFGIPGFPGGFLGVDVFFVISGFLITGLILQEKAQTGSFSYKRFYLRRVRRLMPAALVVIALSLVLFLPILTERDMANFLESVPFSIFSLANVYFYREVGYFDTAAQYKPLLHMWSLGVEEQFYLIWPAMLLLLSKSGKLVLTGTIAILLASLSAAVLMIDRDPSAVYYLLPYRAFELLIGAWLAIGRFRAPSIEDRLGPKIGNLAGVLGVIMVVAAYCLLDENSPMPGIASLLPCVGAALIINFGGAGFVGWMLTRRPVVWIGLISYSLYLVHWPLVVYLNYRLPEAPPIAVMLSLIPFSVALAAASYYLIEQRFRKLAPSGEGAGNARFLTGLCSALLLLCIPSAVFLAQGDGALAARVEDKVRVGVQRQLPFPGSPSNEKIVRIEGRDGSPKAKVLVLGDSHAGHLKEGLRGYLAPRGISADVAAISGCPPLFDVSRFYGGNPLRRQREEDCRANSSAKRTLAYQDDYDVVILAARWYSMFEKELAGTDLVQDGLVDVENFDSPEIEDSRAVFEASLDRTIEELSNAGKRIIVLSQVPPLGNDLMRCGHLFPWVEARPGSRCFRITRQQLEDRAEFTDTAIEDAGRRPGVLSIVPRNIFCDAGGECLLYDPETGEFLYNDSNHLSPAGSLFLLEEADRRYGLTNFILSDRLSENDELR